MIAVTGAAGPTGRALIRALLGRMSETGGPQRVIAIDTPERIERLVLPRPLRAPEPPAEEPADAEAAEPAAPGLEYRAEGPVPARREPLSDEPPHLEPPHLEPPEPTLVELAPLDPDAAAVTRPPTSPESPERTDDPAPDDPAGPRPRRRSYLPSGLTSNLPGIRREPRESKEEADPEAERKPDKKAAKKAEKPEPDEPRAVPELGIVPGQDSGVDWRGADISSPDVVTALVDADIVIHLSTADDLAQAVSGKAADRRLRAVRTAQAVSMAAAAVGARRLVSVTSAMVLGARPDNPVPLADDATCRADPDDGLVGDLLEVERVLERIPRVHPGLAFTLIRPAALVGPGVDTAVTRHFEAPRLLVLRGAGTRWQFCHVEDLADAIWTVVTAGIDGPLTVGADDSMDETEVETISGMRRLEVPAGLAFSTAERLHRVGVLNTPASELAYVVHPWVIGSARLLAAGWRPRHDNESCLKGLLDDQRRRRASPGRRVNGRDAAAMGAAGAAVALLGTAAIVRQARSRQSKRRRSTLDP